MSTYIAETRDEKSPTRKIIVTGISPQTTEETLTLFFENTRKSGGGYIEEVDFHGNWAIVTFENPEVVGSVLRNEPLILDKERILVERFTPKRPQTAVKPSCTIEVRGFSRETSVDTLENYFGNKKAAGKTVEVVKVDTSRRDDQGVVYITYKTEEVTDAVLARRHTLHGTPLEVRRLIPSLSTKPPPVSDDNVHTSDWSLETENSFGSLHERKWSLHNAGLSNVMPKTDNTYSRGMSVGGRPPVLGHRGPDKQIPNDTDNELRIVMIGKTGTGKSATGNTILGRKAFTSKAAGKSVTKNCCLRQSERFGQVITVADTPGLFDTGIDNEKMKKEIVKCIGLTAPGPHAFLLVLAIGRFTQEEQDTVTAFVEMFGESMYGRLIVLFTGKDKLDIEGTTPKAYVDEASEPLRDILKKCSNRYHAFDNMKSADKTEKDAMELIDTINGITANNGGQCYTNKMVEEAERQIQLKRELLQRKKEEEMQKAAELKQVDKLKEIEERYRKKEENFRKETRTEIEEDGSFLGPLTQSLSAIGKSILSPFTKIGSLFSK